MRRRLLLGLLLCLALAGGLWWNWTRLNETERKLVGAWEDANSGDVGMILLADRRQVFVERGSGREVGTSRPLQWNASPNSITLRQPTRVPFSVSPKFWRDYVSYYWNGKDRIDGELVILNANEISILISDDKRTLRRSDDPRLHYVFERLSAGESPQTTP